MPRLNRYWTIYAIILIFTCVQAYISTGLPWRRAYDGDSASFFHAAEVIRELRPDGFRTPVFPLVIMFFKSVLTHNRAVIAIKLFQLLLFMCSGEMVRRLSLRLITGRWTALVIMAVYLLTPGTVGWTMVCISDSMGISLTAIWLWLMLRDSPGEVRVSSAVWSSVLLLLLVFLRPVFLCLLPVAAFRWLAAWPRRRQTALIGLTGLLTVIGALAAYRAEVNRLYGINAVSSVSAFNNYFLVTEGGNVGVDDAPTPHARRAVELAYQQADTISVDPLIIVSPWVLDMTPVEIEQTVSHALRAHPAGVARSLYNRLVYRLWHYPAVYWHAETPGRITQRFYVPRMGTMILFYVAAGALLVTQIARARRHRGAAVFPVRSAVLWLTGAAMIFTTTVGAQNDWPRLMAPAYPATLLLIVLVASCFNFKKPNEVD